VSEEQNVSAVLIGSVLRRGDTLAVTVELIDGRDSTLIWSQRYTRQFSDIFVVEEDIARQVAGALRTQLTEEDSESLARRGKRNPESYQALLRGDCIWERAWLKGVSGEEGARKAIDHYERAI
jgi:adenylate cyclase